MKKLLALALILSCAGCISYTSQPIDHDEPIKKVCIQRNPKVIVPEFTNLLQEAFARNHIKATVYDEIPEGCAYHITYVAYQRWDLVMFLYNAHFDLFKGDDLIGYADRNMPPGSGFDFSKWDPTSKSVNMMVDQLLAKAPSEPPAPHETNFKFDQQYP